MKRPTPPSRRPDAERPKRPPSTNGAVSVFRFLDARDFLRQAYQAEKRVNRNFSHRYIAKAMGAGSSSFFKDVVLGKLPLTPARAARFAELFHLPAQEAEYLQTLVLYADADTQAERDRLLKKLSGAAPQGGQNGQAVLEASQLEYLKKWHYAAVRELLAFIDFQGDYAALAERLDPPITAVEARDAVQLLLRLRLIRKNAQGRLEKADNVIVSGPKPRHDPEDVKPALRANLKLAERALDAYAPAVRPFSYMTLSVSRDTVQYIHERLLAARREILDRVSRDETVDRLYQLNIQLFPLSKAGKRSKS
jgi:uncharacterized protein (TIGR02147 family)